MINDLSLKPDASKSAISNDQYYADSPNNERSGPFRSQIAIFRPSSGLWAIRGYTRFYFGTGGDSPVNGDFDGSALDNTAIFRPSSALWAIRGVTRVYYGASGDIPVTR